VIYLKFLNETFGVFGVSPSMRRAPSNAHLLKDEKTRRDGGISVQTSALPHVEFW